MAVLFGRIKKSELGKTFTHYGLIHGWVPVLIGDLTSSEPLICEENDIPTFVLDLGTFLAQLTDAIAHTANPRYESRGFELRVMGRFEKDGTRVPY